MSKGYTPEAHPIIPPPTLDQIMAESRIRNCTAEAAAMGLIRRRQEVINQEKEDPLRYGWEATIWKVCDALLGFEFCDGSFRRHVQERFGWTWEQWSRNMLDLLGIDQAVVMLLILGGNRTSKSEYAAKRGQNILTTKEGANVYPFHMSNPRSIRDQQPLFWKYMPPEYRTQTAGVNEYIKYKRKTGFSEGSFINPIGSECAFLNYMQDRDTALEGMEADLLLPDELVPPDWIETMMYRLATRKGKGMVTFTPINGYTASVKIFLDSAEVVRQCIGYMLPKDGGDPDPARALNLSQTDYNELLAADREKRVPRCAYGHAEDCCAWLEGKSGQIEPPSDRVFEMVPRVARCVNPQLAVVWFHPSDNPYGNPKDVMQKAITKGPREVRIRVYGIAEKTVSNMFPKFDRRVHTIEPAAIPAEGSNYFFIDPAEDRNFFMTWLRALDPAAYLYREWPGHYPIPGVGVPDPWAIPSGRKEGVNDGARGGGQESFGFGLLRYKFEIARLERWQDFLRWERDEGGRRHGNDFPYPLEEEIVAWDERNGAEEPVEERYVDSRAASKPRVENDRPVTLYEDLLEIGMDFLLAPGSGIEDGVAKINSALDYDQEQDLSFFNKPKLFLSTACRNSIYAFENWMHVDGERGACKDPIDNVRYYYTAECGLVSDRTYAPRGGFYYGRGGAVPAAPDRARDLPRPGRRRRRMQHQRFAEVNL